MKNIKKICLLILMVFIPIFSHALENSCTYTFNTTKITIYYKTSELPTNEVEYINGNQKYQITSINISNNDMLFTPSTTSENVSRRFQCPRLKSNCVASDNKRFLCTLNVDSSGDLQGTIGNSSNIVESNYNNNTKSCVYNEGSNREYSLTWNGSRAVATIINSENYSNYCQTEVRDFTFSDFANGNCPEAADNWETRYEGSGCRGKLIVSKNYLTSGNDAWKTADKVIDTNSNESHHVQIKINLEGLDCTSLLGNPKCDGKTSVEGCVNGKASPAYYLTFAFSVLRYAAILLLIVYTIIDFISAITSQDADAIKKASKSALKRLVICIIIFILPIIIGYILKLINDKAYSMCGLGGVE